MTEEALAEACAELFDLGPVEHVGLLRRPDSMESVVRLRIRTSSGAWSLDAFVEGPTRADEVAFMAGYAERLSAQGLTPPLQSGPDGRAPVCVTMAGETYHALCRPWVQGETQQPESWDEQYLTEVGRFLARMHDAAAGWQPEFSRPAWNFALPPVQAAERIASWNLVPPGQLDCVSRIALSIEKVVDSLGAEKQTPIHSDPWHGNLLICDGGIQAIDLRGCGLGPREGDIAVWFCWTMNSFGPHGWHDAFQTVLASYQAETAVGPIDGSVIPHLACLRRLWFLVEEVEERMAVAPEDRETMDFYVQDHVSAIREIESLGVLHT
jgi:Ser/Thr protein kinase RdoA (MazF antagonist)